ncbi:MAG: hypothetical protein L6Q26_07050 [Anaerolineales bacterium]|nr:hypothetical protein [Anaerolineales bacterium]NUQ86061.1 hypothetical protein [Anaerolineales bacterium]
MSRKFFIFAICLLLAACNLPGGQQITTSAPQAWFDMPLPDTVFYPPNPCQVIAHGASPNGIAAFEMYVNNAYVYNGQTGDSKQTLATLTTTCPRLNAGWNILKVRAQDSTGAWSEFTQTRVFFAEERSLTDAPPPRATDTPVPVFTAIPTLTPTPIPTLTPTETPTSTPRPTGGVTIERVSTNLVYLGRSNCGPLEVTITARAAAPDGIKVVVLFYRFETGNSSSGFESVGMNPIGGDLYQRTVNPTSLFGGSVPFDAATLQYQVVVQQTNGDVSIRTPVMADISVQACGGVTVSCSSYTDERTCRANGCNWVNIPGTVPIYECRNP